MKVSYLSLLYQPHGGPHWPGPLPEELVDGLGLRHVVGQATLRLCTQEKEVQQHQSLHYIDYVLFVFHLDQLFSSFVKTSVAHTTRGLGGQKTQTGFSGRPANK